MNKHYIDRKFSEFSHINALVIGDVMIDSYIFGDVTRISPEAPVPIISVTQKDKRLGGAANVALNLKSLGANPIMCTVTGNDENSTVLSQLFEKKAIDIHGIIRDNKRITTVKHRMIGNNMQLLRVDEENTTPLDTTIESKFIDTIKHIINHRNIHVIIFEDYDKGVITQNVINEIVSLAQQKGIPTSVDPKKNNFLNYKNVTLFKPNLKELKEGLNVNAIDLENIDSVLNQLHKELHNEMTFVTLSEKGVYITNHESGYHVPAHFRNIADVSGAGDSVISVASLALATEMPMKQIAELANLAGGLVCEKVGVVPIEKGALLSEAIEKLCIK